MLGHSSVAELSSEERNSAAVVKQLGVQAATVVAAVVVFVAAVVALLTLTGTAVVAYVAVELVKPPHSAPVGNLSHLLLAGVSEEAKHLEDSVEPLAAACLRQSRLVLMELTWP